MSSATHSVVHRPFGANAPRDVTTELRPLTERVLARLPGPRARWIVYWALVPWLNAGANLLLKTGTRSAIWDQGRTLLLLNNAALSFAIAIAVWGTRRIAQRLETVRETTWSIEGDRDKVFRETNSVAGPLVASAATAIAFGIGALVADGWVSGFLRGATWFVLGVALWTFLWTYASLALGLDRLGRGRLLPQTGPGDPTLGLQPLGRAAFMGLWIVLAWLIPVVLTGVPGIAGVLIAVFVLTGALAAFFLSLLRLHRGMSEVKVAELTLARELYVQAYEPIRADATLGTLERQSDVLAAADALVKRAQAIREWPMDQGTVAWVIAITTGVIAVTIARLILTLLGS